MIKLSDENLYFCAYYYLFEFKGMYPSIVQEGDETKDNSILLKHCFRKILGIKGVQPELHILEVLRTKNKNHISSEALHFFPILQKNKNHNERTVFVRDKVAEIGRLHHEEDVAPPAEKLTKEEALAVEEKPVEEVQAKDDSVSSVVTFESYKERMGKGFRMTKEQKGRGLSREVALAEWAKGQYP